MVHELERKVEALPRVAANIRYGVCAREQVSNAPASTLEITARDIFD
jgi:hypothetical protein